MSGAGQGAFDPATTFGFLEDGGAGHAFPVTSAFWEELMAGRYRLPEARLVGEGDGWLFSAYAFSEAMPSWEMHPRGDEFLVLLEGELHVMLERDGGPEAIALTQGMACVVPRGVWHRLLPLNSCKLLALTYGKGTEHRPA